MQQVEDQFYLMPDEVSQLLDQAAQLDTTKTHIDVMEGNQAEKTWQLSDERLRALSEYAIISADYHGNIVSWNREAQHIFGYTEDEALGQPLTFLMPERFKGAHQHSLDQVTATDKSRLVGQTIEVVGQRKNGNEFPMELSLASWKTGEGRYYSSIIRDITERVKAEETLRARERYFRALSEQASDLVLILDATGIYRYASPSHQRIMGYAPEKLIGTNAFDFIHPDDLPQALADFAAASHSSKTVIRIECRARHANGSWTMLECVGHNSFDDPAVAGLIINARDITERKAMEEALRHQALHDALTDLPNRTLLLERLAQAIQTAAQNDSGTALLMMDLDRFKDINDTFGPHHGDLLLQQVGTRLRQAVHSVDTVARLGGDEFAVLLPTADEANAKYAATALHAALEEPFTIVGYPLQVTASIGVALYPMHGADPLTLMRHADVAMYTAKRTHEGYALYDVTHDDQDSSRRLALIGALRHAIAANELTLYYQPKVDLKTGAACSVEALARWKHPTFGFVPPDQFIALAEQTGLIAPLTLWVLETAIHQCRDWLNAGLDISIAVNLSTWNLRDTSLPETVEMLLERYTVPPHFFRVELTESAVMTDTDRALDVLMRLSTLGVHVSIDDFGTGYSSLAYLKRLPVDELKIDRSFVQHITAIATDATIVRSTVMMAHSLGLHVVAEGIEDQAAWQLLASLDCDTAQGYYMSRPLPAPELESWLRQTQHTDTLI